MTVNRITQSGNLKEDYTFFKEFMNKMRIKNVHWRRIPKNNNLSLENRCLIFEFYWNDIYNLIKEKERLLKDQKNQISKREFNKQYSQLIRLKDKLQFLKDVYFELWDPNTEFGSNFIKNYPSFTDLIEKHKDKQVVKKVATAISKVQRKHKYQTKYINRATFFRMQNLFMEFVVSKSDANYRLNNFLKKATPKTKDHLTDTTLYSENHLRMIAKLNDELVKQNKLYPNLYTLQHLIKKSAENRSKVYGIVFWSRTFKNVSITTIKKALKLFANRKPYRDKKKIRRMIALKNYFPLRLGIVQLDLKTLTQNKQGIFGPRYYSVDMIEVASGYVYSDLIDKPNAQNIVRVLIKGIIDFKTKGINIIKIQTDHCNIFAPNQGKQHKMFYDALRFFNIEHLLIPFQQPEFNGKVERFHRVIDDEFNLAIRGKTFEEAKAIWKDVIKFYNEQRITSRVRRCDDGNKKYVTIRFIPIERLNYLKTLSINTTN